MSENIRFYYLNTRGRGEGIRKLLHYKGIKFEDIRISKEEWPKKKDSFKYGKVPALEIDGKFLYQSKAILRYLARKYDLEGKDSWEVAKLDELHELTNEFHDSVMDYFYVLMGVMPGDKDKLRQEKFTPAWNQYTPHFEQALKDSGSSFYAKSGLTYIDLIMAEG